MGPVDTGACVHCGLCLPTCPTYLVTGEETESPRGRVLLLSQVWDAMDAGGPGDPGAVRAIDNCLDCRACEEVCPAHVPVGHAVEAFRARAIEAGHMRRPLAARQGARYFGAESGLLRFQRLVRWVGRPAGRGVLRAAARMGGTLGAAARLSAGLPQLTGRQLAHERVRLGGEGPSVALFYGCVMDSVYQATAGHAADLLRLSGYRVVAVPDQGCCGALHTHVGDLGQARVWARRNVSGFSAAGAEWVAVTAAGCGAALKEYDHLLEGEPSAGESVERFREVVRDVVELLTLGQRPPLPPRTQVATVHDACHLAHAQGIRQEVRDVLRWAGYELVDMPDGDVCCGSAGLYNLTHPEMAEALQHRKVGSIPLAADVVATSNPGCLLQIQAGLREAGRATPVAHWVDLVWDAAHDAGVL